MCDDCAVTSCLLLLRRAPRALEGGPIERQHLLGVVRKDSEWGRRATKGALPEDIEVRVFLQPIFKCLRRLLVQWARRVRELTRSTTVYTADEPIISVVRITVADSFTCCR